MMSEDYNPGIWINASGNNVYDVQSSSGNVPLTFVSDGHSETITRESFVVEEVVATDKTIETKIEKDKTYKIVALFSPKGQGVKQNNNQQPHYILTPNTKLSTNQGMPKLQVIAPSNYLETNSPWAVQQQQQSNLRKRSLEQIEHYIPESRRRKANHCGKGLRHFSMKVCEKVQTKQITTYNEVADELVNELYESSDPQSQMDHMFDQKNIRRRVYDALNVLMAMNIISKEKKEIKWIGLPTSTNQEYQVLETEVEKSRKRLKLKKQQLCEILIQQIAFKNLLERNHVAELTRTCPQAAVPLPFILVSTSKQTIIDCNISNDKYEFVFNFDNVFSIHDDIEILRSMGMCPNLLRQHCTKQEVNHCLKHLPVALHSFVRDVARHPPLHIKSEPESSFYTGACSSAADESLDDTGWNMSVLTSADLSRRSSSRSDQPSPNYTNDSVYSE